MKKTIFMLLFVALGLQQALAQNFTFDGLNYTVTSETTASVAGNPGISGAITIPAEVTNNGASLSVTSIGDDAFRGRSGITSVTIPNSVTSIGLAAFYGCSGLTSVTIPNSVTSIGDHSFNGCSGLTSVTIPNSVISIGDHSFNGCSGLTSVTIPNSVTNIGSQAFINCSSLTSVTIPNSLTSIGSGVFKSCSGLTSVTIPNSVTNIGKDAFDGCSGLTSVTIPNSVTSIGLGAFDGCSGLTSVTIPNSVTSIGWGAFADCSGLTSVTIPNSVTSIENHTFSDCSGLTSVTIPNSVTSIDRDAFYNCSGLTSVTIPNSVTRIGKNVFDRCSGLTSVTIGNSVTSIGENAFSRCYGLTSVTIPNSVTSIGDYAFEDCTGLKSVLCEIVTPLSINPTVFQGVNQGACSLTVPITSVTAYAAALVWQNFAPICAPTENTTTVTACANYVWANNNQTYTASGTYTGTTTNCVTEKLVLTITTALDQTNFSSGGLNYLVTSPTTVAMGINSSATGAIIIPASVSNACFDYTVTSIGEGAFQNCSGLTSVTIPNSVTSIGQFAFFGCSGLTSVTIPNLVTSIGQYAFADCSDLTSVTIPNSVTSIGESAFKSCSGLTSVTIPNSVTSIGEATFAYCSGLTSVTIPNSVTSISSGAFYICSGLTSVTIPNSVTSIGESAFRHCSGLTSVTIPNTVTSIDNDVFYGCSGLTSVTIGNSVTNIGEDAFYGCTSLTSVTIPISVKSIGDYAFEGCSGLTSVTIPISVTSIGEATFSECSGITSVTIPNSVTSIGRFAFYGCSGLTSVMIPNSVISIGKGAFSDCSGLTSVVCEIETPLSINPTVFQGVNQGACSLTVPITSVTAYAAALVWQNFAPICAPTENTTTVTACANYVWANNNQTYTASGTYTGTTTNCVTEKLVLTTISTATDQTNFSSGGLNYVVTSPTTVAVGSNSSASGIINIPASVSNACFDYTVTSIGDDAFIDGSSLTSVTMPNTVTSIGSSAFRRCSSLTSLTIPNSVTSIGSGAFFYCSGLTSVMIPNSVTNIGQNAFNSCSGLISVTIPNSLTSIVQGTFSFCTGLTSVTIPNSLTRIGYGAFQYCTALTSVTIPNSVTSIDEFAFFGCSGLTSVTIPNLVTSISDKSFAFCSGLTSVTIPNSVNSIGDQSFRSCTSLKSITIPNSVTSIGRAAFSYCSGLNSVSIPNSVTSIDYGGFAFCSGLTSVSIPNSVKSIGEYTFYNCIALASVVCEIVTPLSINLNVFEEVNQGACSLTVPVGSIVAYEAAPVWKNFTPISCTPTENTTTVTACNSYFWTNNSQTYTASGTYTGTTTNCVTEKLDLTIDITTAPTASAQSFCAGKTVANLAATGTDIKWYAAETGGTALINETALVTGTTYYASQTLNGCESDRTGVAVTVSQQPTTPGAIAGANTICKNTTVTYSIDPVANATSYQWTLPTGATGTSTSNSIAVTFGSTYTVGDLCVQAVNGACMSATTCMTITPAALVPATPGVIAGPVTIAPNTTKTFTIASVANASSYAWTAPANATLVSGQGTTSATFNFGLGYTTGLVIVKANNCLGNSATRSLSVKKVGVSAIRGTHCGKTLATIKTPISATIIPGATKYSFEVSINGSVMQTYETTNYYFNLTQLTNMPSYNTTYSIRVAVLFDNVWQNYGTDCTVKTPTLPLLTKLKATQCGTTLALLTSTIAADEIINANKYQFEISKNNTVVQELLSKTYYTSLSTLTTKVQYGTSYTIRVKYSLDNGVTWSEYGTSCSLTTPTLPLTTKVKATQCGSTLASLNSPISADIVINANKYQFEISKDDILVQELFSTTYYTRLTNLTATAQYGTTYSVRVRYSFDKGATWSAFGMPCNVTTPSAQGLVLNNQNSPEVSVYPNPFSSTFNVATSLEGEVNVKVIDNIGKLIEQFDIDAGELVTKELGQEYVPGMYHVTVTQEMNSKNFKVVKSN